MAEHIKGLGGFPVGISGKGLLMISGGIDSPVAGYLMQKRGVEIEAIHFASPPYLVLSGTVITLSIGSLAFCASSSVEYTPIIL